MSCLSDRHPVNALKCCADWEKEKRKNYFVACTSVGSASQDPWKVISECDRSATRPQLMQDLHSCHFPFPFLVPFLEFSPTIYSQLHAIRCENKKLRISLERWLFEHKKSNHLLVGFPPFFVLFFAKHVSLKREREIWGKRHSSWHTHIHTDNPKCKKKRNYVCTHSQKHVFSGTKSCPPSLTSPPLAKGLVRTESLLRYKVLHCPSTPKTLLPVICYTHRSQLAACGTSCFVP